MDYQTGLLGTGPGAQQVQGPWLKLKDITNKMIHQKTKNDKHLKNDQIDTQNDQNIWKVTEQTI